MEAQKEVTVREAPYLTGDAAQGSAGIGRGIDLRAVAEKVVDQANANADINQASQSVSRTTIPVQGDMKRPQTGKLADAVNAVMKRRKKKKMVARSGIVAFFKGDKEEGANNQKQAEKQVSFGEKIKGFMATAQKKVNALLIEGTSTQIFFFFAGILMAFTMFYIIQYIIVQAIAQYSNPPGQFSIEYASSLQTPAIRICPDQKAINLTKAEDYGFFPFCVANKNNLPYADCKFIKTPDKFGDDPALDCYVLNSRKAGQDAFDFEGTDQSLVVVFYAQANLSNPDLTYLGVPFTLFHDSEYDMTEELPRTGYVPFGNSAMATVTLDKHISLTGSETWYFTTPGLTTLDMSEDFLSFMRNQLSGNNITHSELESMHPHVLNIRYASLQVTTTKEYIPLGPLEIIAALGGILSLATGVLQSLYPPAERLKRRFIFDVVEEEEVEVDENPSSPRGNKNEKK